MSFEPGDFVFNGLIRGFVIRAITLTHKKIPAYLVNIGPDKYGNPREGVMIESQMELLFKKEKSA